MSSPTRLRQGVPLALILLAAIIALGCQGAPFVGTDRIADIERSPDTYLGKEVRLRGVVKASFKTAGVPKGLYLINDGTGQVWVITESATPHEKSHVALKGRVKVGLIVAGRAFGVAVVETKRL